MILDAFGTIFPPCVGCNGRLFHWCFDGSIVALFPGAVHSPRHDDLHDRERDEFTCGDGTGRPVAARFLTERTERRILLNPELALGEAYMDGTFVVENGSIADALAILMDQPEILPRWARLQWWLRYLARHPKQFNPRGRARNNVAHHYDLDGRLYSLFLDADKQYSCAYFETPDATLDDAQLAKKRHLAAKLLIGRGDRVLDIGSGWGGLGLYLAEMTGADVTGITLSTEQLQVSNARAAEKNLARIGEIPAAGLSRRSPAPSTASCRSACSSMSASTSTRPISGAAPSCSATTASWCCIRSAARPGPT